MPTRFAWVLQGATCGPDSIFDEDLANYPDAAVIPTRGALVAEWLLVVPRTPCLSVAELAVGKRARLLSIADEVLERMRVWAGSCVLFEHGPSRQGTATGCGVDQAHLHVVGGLLATVETLAKEVRGLHWELVDHIDPWSTVPSGYDYLMLRDQTRALRALIECPVSQRLRQAIANSLGRPSEWDYRTHPQAENAVRTKQIFRGKFARAA